MIPTKVQNYHGRVDPIVWLVAMNDWKSENGARLTDRNLQDKIMLDWCRCGQKATKIFVDMKEVYNDPILNYI